MEDHAPKSADPFMLRTGKQQREDLVQPLTEKFQNVINGDLSCRKCLNQFNCDSKNHKFLPYITIYSLSGSCLYTPGI